MKGDRILVQVEDGGKCDACGKRVKAHVAVYAGLKGLRLCEPCKDELLNELRALKIAGRR